jgi:lysyl-tRNA synthetase class 2
MEAGWRPSCSLDMLAARAGLLTRLRAYFAEHRVIEVDTPLLSRAATPAPYLQSFETRGERRFLQTSPEFAMKRLLAAGSGPIYQIAKAFREEEAGRHHNPEFTLLEWYRPGWSSVQLMDEIEALLTPELGGRAVQRISYAQAFTRWVAVDPHGDDTARLRQRALDCGLQPAVVNPEDDRDTWLDLLLGHVLVPAIRDQGGVFLTDYPASQAALAKVGDGAPPLADRFELFVDGVELANGFCELTDADEQRRRFEAENRQRISAGVDAMPLDEAFLAALQHGLPDCSGVAVGIDRLLMLVTGSSDLDAVLAFPWRLA